MIIMLIQLIILIKMCFNSYQIDVSAPTVSPLPIVAQTPSVIVPPTIQTERIIDPVKLYDYQKLNDPLEDPTKRVNRYELGPLEYRRMFNFPTQGYPDNYRWMGILIADDNTTDDKNKIIKLFGRQKIPRSNEYQYYTAINMGHDQVKIHLHQKKELYDHDTVHIRELGKTYHVQLNKDDDLTYNPYF